MPSFAFHPGFAGNSVRANPWEPTQYIVSAADNFGVSGSGKVYIVNALPATAQEPAGNLRFLTGFGTSDSAFDACFSEVTPTIVIVACGDALRVYDLNMIKPGSPEPAPVVATLSEHRAEVPCVAWANGGTDQFLSSSWDQSIKLWSFGQLGRSVNTFLGHQKEVYEVSWHPKNPAMFVSASGDGTWRVWDVRRPSNGPNGGAVITVPGHNYDIILSADWNRYDGNLLATGGVDKMVKVWDMRRAREPVVPLKGHDAAARRVRWSPHSRTQLMSSGYDFRVNIWDLEKRPQFLTHRYEQHREFVVGCEWHYAAPGHVISASWDGMAYAWQVGRPVVPTPPQAQGQLPPCTPPPRPPGASRLMRPGGQPGPVAAA